MFAWKDRKGFQETIAKLVSAENNGQGANRRAINLVPLPAVRETHEIAQSHRIRYHQLLVSIEAKQSTCCIRVISEISKSRSAILVFRGRVLGCLYGSKTSEQQLFGQEAHQRAMSDLAKPDNIVDTYLLSEELVLAGGALFHGHQVDHLGGSPEQAFESAATHLMHSNSPGCMSLIQPVTKRYVWSTSSVDISSAFIHLVKVGSSLLTRQRLNMFLARLIHK